MVPSSPGWFDSSQNLTDDKKQTLVFSGSDFLGTAQTSQIAAMRHNGRTEAFALEPRASDQICSFFFSYYLAILFNPQTFQRWGSE